MKKLSFVILFVIFSCASLMGCSINKNNTLSNKVLTPERKTELENAADEVFKTGITPGMVALISIEGEDDFFIKRGVSNIQNEEPINENNYYRIASVTKTFTATSILILADEGKINLDSSINTYLPELNIPNGDTITVRMLGNMTSGLYNYSADESLWPDFTASNYLKTYTAKDLLNFAFNHPVSFAPGAKEEYCNTNYIILGQLIEKITDKPVSQAIDEMVIKPLNLTNTYWPEWIYLSAPYIHGYNSDNQLLDATNWNPSWGNAAGQLISNFTDMKIWAKALAEGQLLSDNMKTERFKWVDDHYGFGIMKAGDWVGHPGTIPGYNSHVFYNSKKKITLIILANTDTNLPVEYFSDAFRKILDK